MKKYPSIVLGVISACCLLSAHVIATEETDVEKSCCPPKKTPTCTACFTPTYATLIQSVASPSTGPTTLSQITVAFDKIQTARGITFDETVAPDSFTLSKGIYSFKFQFSMIASTVSGPVSERFFRFTDMYLDINNDSSRIALDWNMWLNDATPAPPYGFSQYYWASFSGSKIISIGEDNTVVKFILLRDPNWLGPILFAYDPFYPADPLSTNNNPVRVNIHKINGCPT